MPPTPPPTRILFVCLGNICRSPAAAVILRKLVAAAGRDGDFEIDSAGTGGHNAGSPPDPRMSASLAKHGVTMSGTARQLRLADLEKFDLIVTMDESNYAEVRRLDAGAVAQSKIRPFMSFCRHYDDPRVPDPYYGGQSGFDHVIRLLEDGCQGLLESC